MVRDVRRTPPERRGSDQRGGEVVRITTAATSPQADIAARQRRYTISMAFRTVCFIAAVAVGPGWLRWVLVAGAVLLPYVAVVMANAATTKSDGFGLPPGGFENRELGPAPDDTPDDTRPHP